MHSSANAAVVGLIVIIGIVLVAGAIMALRGSTLLRRGDYYVIAAYENVAGIMPGMRVTASGLEVGYVEKIVEPAVLNGRVGVKLRLDERVKLTPEASAVVTQADFMGEKSIELDGLAGPGYSGELLAEDAVIRGINHGGLNQMITSQLTGATELLSLKVEEVVDSVMVALTAATRVLEASAGIVEGSEDNVEAVLAGIQGTVANMNALSRNLNAASAAVAELAQDPRHRETVETLAANLTAMSENLAHTTATLSLLAEDPQIRQDAQGTTAAVRAAMEDLQRTTAQFPATMEKVNTLLDTTNTAVGNVGAAIEGVSGVIDTVGGAVSGVRGKTGGGGLQTRLTIDTRSLSPDMTPRYSGEGVERTRDINAVVGFRNVFAEFGYDGIGSPDGGANFMVGQGNASKGLSYKTGAYRGEVGTGVSWRYNKNTGIDGFMYDANDPKYNVSGRVGVTENFGVVVGVEDALGDEKLSLGASTTF